jgi:hypothetical protein
VVLEHPPEPPQQRAMLIAQQQDQMIVIQPPIQMLPRANRPPAATPDQLNPMSTATEDTLSFHSAPQRQDAIEMLSNCEWDVERAESLGLTKPIAP